MFSECSCSFRPNSTDFLTNCTNAGLTSIPNNIPIKTTHLVLCGNNLNTIKNNSFINLTNLKILDLTNNHIYQLESKAFLNLENLTNLLLKDNHLNVKRGSYSLDVFNPLGNQLKVLDIRGNLKVYSVEDKEYPGLVLAPLTSLEKLRLDCISNKSLTSDFANLFSLKELDFSNTKAPIVANRMFHSVRHSSLEVLNFTNVNVTQINGQIFSILPHLKVLDLTNNPLLKSATENITYYLKNTSIAELYLTHTCLGVTASTDKVIDNLRDTKIKVLTFDSNQISKMGVLFGKLPYLEMFTIANNGFQGFFHFFGDVNKAKNLRKLDVDIQTTYIQTYANCHQPSKSIQTNEPLISDNQRKNLPKRPCQFRDVCMIDFPPKLEWMSLSSVSFKIDVFPQVKFNNNGTLKYFDISNNMFDILQEPFLCNPSVVSTIEYFDVSSCGIKCVNRTMFNFCLWSFKYVNISHNKLGLLQGNCNVNPSARDLTDVIKPLTTLISLDMSSNYINQFYNDSFEMQKDLRELRVSNNKLKYWEPSMDHLIHLELLDLSFNLLTTLSEITRLTLSQLESHPKHRTKEHIFINLEGNPLACTCENIQFLKWIKATHVVKLHFEKYRCVHYHGKEVNFTDRIEEIISDLESECSSNTWLILITVLLSVYFVMITIGTVCFRLRHYIRYLVFRVRMRRERLETILGRKQIL